MFRATHNKGFHVTLNGYTLSVQWGPDNYCSDRSSVLSGMLHVGGETFYSSGRSSETAEIALWRASTGKGRTPGEMLQITPYDIVAGHVEAEKIATIMFFLAHSAPESLTEAWVTRQVRKILDGIYSEIPWDLRW